LEAGLDLAASEDLARAYFAELLEATGMEALAPLSVSPAVDDSMPGFSAIQELTTSHASFHYFAPTACDPAPRLHLDLFSCRAFELESFIRIAARHFHLAEWSATYVLRSIDAAARETWQLEGQGAVIGERCRLLPEGADKQQALVGVQSQERSQSGDQPGDVVS